MVILDTKLDQRHLRSPPGPKGSLRAHAFRLVFFRKTKCAEAPFREEKGERGQMNLHCRHDRDLFDIALPSPAFTTYTYSISLPDGLSAKAAKKGPPFG